MRDGVGRRYGAVGILLLGTSTVPVCLASEALCALFEDKKNGDYMFLEGASMVQAASRRGLDEPAKVGFTAVKGALARRLSGDLNSYGVRWSGAVQKGPFMCTGYKVVTVVVDPLNVRIVPEAGAPVDAD